VQYDPLAPFLDEEQPQPRPVRDDRGEQGRQPRRHPARSGLRRSLVVGGAVLLAAIAAVVEGPRLINRTGLAAPRETSADPAAPAAATNLPVAPGERTKHAPGATDRPVKVFILAGDSNMAGRPLSRLLKSNPARTREHFGHLIRDGGWVVRDDVWIKYLDRKGNLTVGFGQTPERFGPELEFGQVIGDYFDEQVLVIKTCWGGHRLCAEFRSPGMGPAPQNLLEEIRQELRVRNPDATLADAEARCGVMYRDMLTEVRQTLANLGAHFPAYRGQGYELAGFVWFSGWSDIVHPDYSYGYSAHLADLIRDVRADLGAPHLPFVIGQMGVSGGDEPGKHGLDFRAQQAAVADLPEFAGNVALVVTDPFWDREAQAVYKKGWKDHLDEWNRFGSDHPYHYLGSAQTIILIGRAFGEAMIGLLRPAARDRAGPAPLTSQGQGDNFRPLVRRAGAKNRTAPWGHHNSADRRRPPGHGF
ncbi:MAG: sialate O-acetylesterase, partial [Planctomycetia bacterium]|nr:sialate O-acetylesterase [Planctomycetia bacterium]